MKLVKFHFNHLKIDLTINIIFKIWIQSQYFSINSEPHAWPEIF